MTTSNLPWILSTLGLVSLALGTVLSIFPLWKSATLSPDSIERRVYWTGATLAVLLFFLSALPNWREGMFVAIAGALAVVAIAWRCTNHVKFRGRTYAGTPSLRKRDRPPALAENSEDRYGGKGGTAVGRRFDTRG